MNIFLEEISKAIAVLMQTGILLGVYWIAKISSKEKGIGKPSYFLGILIVVGLSLLSAYNLGKYSEENDEDPVYGLSQRIEDFEPTLKDRVKKFIYLFSLFIIPVLWGIFDGLKAQKREQYEQQQKMKN